MKRQFVSLRKEKTERANPLHKLPQSLKFAQPEQLRRLGRVVKIQAPAGQTH